LAPVVVGGFVAGWLLDRFDRRKVMLIDSLFRGLVVLVIPVLYGLGLLETWHIFAVVSVYGFLFMIAAAGGPSILPSLVHEEQLSTANALEMLGFTLSSVVAPPLAGFLIPYLGAPNLLIFDAFTYFAFALALAGVSYHSQTVVAPEKNESGMRMRDAFILVAKNPVLRAITLMYMASNIAGGAFMVWLPVYADRALGGGSQLYGTLLGFNAFGQVASSILAGMLAPPLPLGTMIILFQFLAGGTLLSLLAFHIPVAIVGLLISGFFEAPLTIWAQTVRMKIIPAELRGRTFALLRTLMLAALPLGGLVGGALLPAVGMTAMIALSTSFNLLPPLLGSRVKELRKAT
jgi:MFS family permease